MTGNSRGRSAVRRAIGRLWRPALVVVCSAAPAAAQQERPPLLPERDVAIAYRMVGGAPGAASEIRMSWLAAESLQRIELGNGLGAAVLDHRNLGASFAVLDPPRMIVAAPADAAGAAGVPGGPGTKGRFTRTGAMAAYAGLACAVWRYEDEKQNGEACLTADGVLLRGSGTDGGRSFALEATQVAYAPQDPARFRRPDGYRVVRPQASPPAAAAPAR